MMRGLKYPTFSPTVLDKWEWQEDAVDVASISIKFRFCCLIKPEPVTYECNHTVWSEWDLKVNTCQRLAQSVLSGVNRNLSDPSQERSVFWLEAQSCYFAKEELNLPNIIRGKEYMCIPNNKEVAWKEDSWGLPLNCNDTDVLWSGRFLFIWHFQLCARNRSTLGKLLG